MRWKSLAALGAGLMVCGCQTTIEGSSEIEPAPANYRQIAAAHVRSAFFDPYSVRDAEIAPPVRAKGPSLNADGFKTPWVICFRANAKNRMGGYTGRAVTALAVSKGVVVNVWDEARYSGMVCDGVVYQQFPEIEQGRQATDASPSPKTQ